MTLECASARMRTNAIVILIFCPTHTANGICHANKMYLHSFVSRIFISFRCNHKWLRDVYKVCIKCDRDWIVVHRMWRSDEAKMIFMQMQSLALSHHRPMNSGERRQSFRSRSTKTHLNTMPFEPQIKMNADWWMMMFDDVCVITKWYAWMMIEL